MLGVLYSEENYIIAHKSCKLGLKCQQNKRISGHRYPHKVNPLFIISGRATRFAVDDSADKSLSCLLPWRVRDIPTEKSQMLNAQSALKKSHARLSSSFGGRLGWKGLQPIIIVTYCSNCVEVRKRFCKLAAILLHHGTMDCCCLHAY